MLRNTSGQRWRVFAFNVTTNQEVTGDAANITAKLSKDYGTAKELADVNPTETEDGFYLFDLTQSETNAFDLAIYPESSTPDVQVIGVPGNFVTESSSGSTPAPSASVSGTVPFDLVGGVVEPTEVVIGNVPESGAKSGTIQLALIVGDDYLATNGRSLSWPVTVPTGTTIGGSSCELRFIQASGACTPFEITFDGSITVGDAGFAVLSFDMPSAETVTIVPGEYEFFVMWIGDDDEEITKVYNRQLVKWKLRSV